MNMDNNQELEQIIPEETPTQPAEPQPVSPSQPVYGQPVYPQPVYRQAAYGQPIYPQPMYGYPVYQQPAPPPAKKGKLWKQFVSIALVVAMVITGCLITAVCTAGYLEYRFNSRNAALLQSVEERINAAKEELAQSAPSVNGDSVSGTPNVNPEGGMTAAKVYQQNVDSVVTVLCTISNGYMQGTSQGSGFVLTADGYVVTNYHVVEGSRSISVKLKNGTEYNASYIGGDQNHDIALIKAEAADLKPVSIGKSDNLIVGDQVVAIGYPLSTQVPVLTVGYVSAKDQIVDTGDTAIRMLQTDAAINSGNSGGPLFNMNGEVIGITSAKYSGNSSSGAAIEGVGFAIPIDDVMGKLTDLKDKGYISGAYLGITGQNISQQLAFQYGISGGVYVTTVSSGSCAQKAGLQRDDIIVNLAGYDIATMSDLSMVLQRLEAGQNVTITVYRSSSRGNVVMNITLDEKPQQ